MYFENVFVPLCDPRFRGDVIAIYKGKDPGKFVYLQNARNNGSTAGKAEYEAMVFKWRWLLARSVEGQVNGAKPASDRMRYGHRNPAVSFSSAMPPSCFAKVTTYSPDVGSTQ
jgi:hypothetical protein